MTLRRARLLAILVAVLLVASCTVTTRPTLEITPGGRELAEGEALQLLASRRYAGGNAENVTALLDWSSTDPATVRVSNKPGTKGLVEAVGSVGRVFVRARDTLGGVEETLLFTVRPASIKTLRVLPSPAVVVGRGDTTQLQAMATLSNRTEADVTSRVSWSSSSYAVATVNDTGAGKGAVTGVSPGTANVTATDAETGVQSSTVVFVPGLRDLRALTITPNPHRIAVTGRAQFVVTAIFSDGSTANFTPLVSWRSSDPTVASIDGTGTASGLKKGDAAITAETTTNARATALLTVE